MYIVTRTRFSIWGGGLLLLPNALIKIDERVQEDFNLNQVTQFKYMEIYLIS